MSRKEKYLYQENRLGYLLMLLFIIANTIYTIMELNNMLINNKLGISICLNIILSLVTFLAAVKVKKYVLNWNYLALLLGIIQFVRIKFIPLETLETSKQFVFYRIIQIFNRVYLIGFNLNLTIYQILKYLLLLSGIIAITAGILSLRKCIIRIEIIKAKNAVKVVG